VGGRFSRHLLISWSLARAKGAGRRTTSFHQRPRRQHHQFVRPRAGAL